MAVALILGGVVIKRYFEKVGDRMWNKVDEGKSPHKKGTAKYKKHMAAMHAESEYKHADHAKGSDPMPKKSKVSRSGETKHPLRGKWKPKVTSKDVTLNLGKEVKVPKGDWGKIVHDKESMWMASWTDYLTQKRKYVWLADTAGIKQDRDKAKYDKAKMLAGEIETVKNKIVKDMGNKDAKVRRISTVCWLIYRTAMRVGDEKDPEEADTVGATTLRKEHVTLTSDTIKFDFLGKDSVRWQETVPAVANDKQFHENLKELTLKIKPTDEIFGNLTSRDVNEYYKTVVDGLTAKVFRTFSASTVVSKYLNENGDVKKSSQMEKLYHAKLANLEAAKTTSSTNLTEYEKALLKAEILNELKANGRLDS